MSDFLRRLKLGRRKRGALPLDFDAGILFGAFCAVYAGIVGGVRGLSPDIMTGRALGLLVAVFGIAGAVVGSVIVGRPDFGPSKRTAAVRGFIAAIPLYATGGLFFLPVERWFALLPPLTVFAAALVGPPIGVFAYRHHRRREAKELPIEPGVELAWLKGEMLGSWTPLLLSVAILASLGVGMRVLPEEMTASPPRPPVPPTLAEIRESLPELRRAVETDSMDPGAHFRLGTALFSFGRFAAAEEQFRIATDIDSTDVTFWLALGRACYFSGFPERSARAFWNALRLDPTALALGGLDRVVLDAALSIGIQRDAVPETATETNGT